MTLSQRGVDMMRSMKYSQRAIVALLLLEAEQKRSLWYRLSPFWWFRRNLYWSQFVYWRDALHELRDAQAATDPALSENIELALEALREAVG